MTLPFGVFWLIATGEFGEAVTSVPPLPAVPSHLLPAASTLGGPHSQNLTVPLHVAMPVTVTVASSATELVPSVSIGNGLGIVPPAPVFGVVVRLEPQSWKL